MVNRGFLRGFYILIFILLIFIVDACSNDENVFDAPVELKEAEVKCKVDGKQVEFKDTVFYGISAMHVFDSVLLIKSSNSAYDFHFHAFSLPDLSWSGSYVSKGRGKNELVTPLMKNEVRSDTGDGMVLFDLSRGSLWRFDLRASLAQGSTVLDSYSTLPPNTLDAYVYKESVINLIPKADDYICQVTDSTAQDKRTYSLYPNLSGIGYLDKLSSSAYICQENGILAMAMCKLPQINFLDINTGEKKTVATTSEYKKWRTMIEKENVDSKMYYTSLRPFPGGFIVLFHNAQFMDWAMNKGVPRIHVFDWSGRFLYDMEVSEKLKSITFDSHTNLLYGVDTDDCLYVYDLSQIQHKS